MCCKSTPELHLQSQSRLLCINVERRFSSYPQTWYQTSPPRADDGMACWVAVLGLVSILFYAGERKACSWLWVCQCAYAASSGDYLLTGFKFQPDKPILYCQILPSALSVGTSGEGPALARPLCQVCTLLSQTPWLPERLWRASSPCWTRMLLCCLWFSACRQQPLEDSVITDLPVSLHAFE